MYILTLFIKLTEIDIKKREIEYDFKLFVPI